MNSYDVWRLCDWSEHTGGEACGSADLADLGSDQEARAVNSPVLAPCQPRCACCFGDRYGIAAYPGNVTGGAWVPIKLLTSRRGLPFEIRP